MANDPVDAAFVDGADVPKVDVRHLLKNQTELQVGQVSDVRNNDYTGRAASIYVRSLRFSYELDAADTTTSDNGTSVLIDVAGNRWKVRQQADPGVRFVGEWDSGDEYVVNDIVHFDGSAYIAKAGNANKQPDTNPTDWATLASGGQDGAPGIDGTDGVDGSPGAPGEGLGFDIQVDELSDRDAHDGEAQGFRVLVSDTGDGRAAIYSKISASSGDWSAPAYLTIDGAVVGPASSTSTNLTMFNGVTGKVIADSGVAVSTDGTMAANSDAKLPTEKAVKTYVAAEIAAIASTTKSFAANKNGVNQTAIPSVTWTKVTFGTEDFDEGSHYDASNSRWTPPAGKVRISAAVYVSDGVVDQAQSLLAIYKNGSAFRYVAIANASGANGFVLNGSYLDNANGTDYYEIYVNCGGAGDKTVHGSQAYSFFQGQTL